MLWRGQRESSNVEDRRSFGGMGTKIAGGGIGSIILYVVITFLGGGNPLDILNQSSEPTIQTPVAAQRDDEAAAFVKVVLADCEDIWHAQFAKMGKDLREPHLVLFRRATQSACGNASSASGPFYCSEDERIYIDLSFYDELHTKLGAPGDFAMAYVVAHEFGHHIQKLTGVLAQVHNKESQLGGSQGNKLSVRLELQADFYAGVWANHAQEMKKILEPGDIDEALNAASAVGDDRLQKQSQGYIVPDAFTHGSSAQRMYWFKKGYETGDVKQGDTFNSSM